jgi:alkanesulfonate monooxygenase SsuD/methylene tetrahydromethanopterin reductase-like flavin-dependent oxidoreductase (luciferase family)
MRLSALVLQQEPWADAQHTWRRLEQLGFDAGYVADHLTHSTLARKWWADGWTTLAAAAGVTDRLLLGTLVASAAIRSPSVLARTSATLQDISGGRFLLGLGAGLPSDVLADRGELCSAQHLWARYAETVSALRALWLGSSVWSGERVAVEGVEPRPHAPGHKAPPLVLSAHGAHGFDLVARQGDGWNTFGGKAGAGLGAEDFWALLEDQSTKVTRACERIRRDPATLRRSVLVGYGAYRPLESVEDFLYAVQRAERAGFDELVVYYPTGARGDRFWADPDVLVEAVTTARALA